MNNVSIVLSPDYVTIKGKYYTVSNGFISKAEGLVSLNYRDLLSVEVVKRRSKKIMYGVLLLGSILIFSLSIVRGNIERQIKSLDFSSIKSAGNTLQTMNYTIQQGQGSELYKNAKVAVTAIIILVAIVCVACIVYLFSGRKFLEITSMGGTYRVRVRRGDMSMRNTILQLKNHTSHKQ